MRKSVLLTLVCAVLAMPLVFLPPAVRAATVADYQDSPLFLGTKVPPLVMLVMGRDHKLYYEAYNDASDLNEDGTLDVGFDPNIEYYGYFDSYKCYTYSSSNQRFEPSSETTTRACTSSDTWSGNFLNYLTMSRMDCLRKVLYGGYRYSDTTTTGDSSVVLSRVYVPQDAHSWGKEFNGQSAEGYSIADYTPLSEPNTGTRHLFACTTLSDNGTPILRVLPNNTHRIWEWVSKERPVCDNSLATAGGTYPSHPANHTEYESMVLTVGIPANLQGSAAPSNGRIDGSGNPYGADDYYLTIFTGTLNVTSAGTYQFAVDGDDAVEVIIDNTVVAGWYNGHGKCTCTTYSGSIALTAGAHSLVFRHEERTGDDNYYLRWKGPDSSNSWEIVPTSKYSNLLQTVYSLDTPSSSITDYVVRVVVCDPDMPESNCKQYPSGTWKPVGLLQKYGETDKMNFGLISGSYAKNTSGGVLRKKVTPLANASDAATNEINANTGQILAPSGGGVINTLNKLRIVGFSYSDYSYNQNCGWVTTRAINEGECRMWGDPIAEMMYEGVRYFAGKAAATSAFTYSGTTDDSTLGLPVATWDNPYTTYQSCAKPIMLVISDVNPSYDSNQLPGTLSAFGSFSGDLSGLSVRDEANTIGSSESTNGTRYIGQSGTTYDSACTAKTVTGLGEIRGLCPEEPSKQGSYYSAAVSYWAKKTDLNARTGEQKLDTYAVGLASPLPRITIPMSGGGVITLVPFAKSVGGYSIDPAGTFQPTNTIVDFYVEEITPTSGVFRINYEDVEQGADHDMDAICKYEYQVSGSSVTITLRSEYAAGSIIQHMGYIISGTTADGTYLEVRDTDTSSDVDYRLDTPPGQPPGGTWNDGAALPLTATRTFTAGTGTTSTLLRDPLWFAAKWGGFQDYNGDGLPDQTNEWDADGNGVPDNYFYVTNPLRLEEQLSRTFAQIVQRVASGTAVSILSTSATGDGSLFQAYFNPSVVEEAREAKWLGYLLGIWVDEYGNLREDTNHDYRLVYNEDSIIQYYFDASSGEVLIKKWRDNDENCVPDTPESSPYEVVPLSEIGCFWEAGKLLATRTAASRDIKTFVDADNDGVVDSGEVMTLTESNASTLRPYLQAPTDTDAENIIRFIRGEEVTGYRAREVTVGTEGVLTWKLGDIISSNPASVGKPSSGYDLIYGDTSYDAFYRRHQTRDTMLYVGANDGMLHAFWAGNYHQGDDSSTTAVVEHGWYDGSAPPVSGLRRGDELWAYVPYNLLPHLKWLTANEYPHVYYVDLKPRLADAKVFPTDADHPQGWGTILVGGMGIGGGNIDVTDTFGGGSPETRTFRSAYFALDVTTPATPRVLWEFADADMGLSTSSPAIIKVGNSWFAVFGSGPTERTGNSTQTARVYVLDLYTGQVLRTISAADTKAFFNEVTGIDVGVNYDHDVMYVGETYRYLSGSDWIPRGKVYRLSTANGGIPSNNPATWTLSPLVTTSDYQPVTTAVDAAFDAQEHLLVYFGTGKFMSQADKEDVHQQRFFGVKDPCYRGTCTTEVNDGDLLNTTNVEVHRDVNGAVTIEGLGGVTTWEELLDEMESHSGWYFNLQAPGGTTPSERVLARPTLFEGRVLFTSFFPNVDPCGYGGDAWYYMVDYLTGTATQGAEQGQTGTEANRGAYQDFGMPSEISLHIGKEGATPFIQTSTGRVFTPEGIESAIGQSGVIIWKENR